MIEKLSKNNTLRSYQKEVLQKVYSYWSKRVSRLLVQMPTGTGKTELFSGILSRYCEENPNSKILIVVHRVELVDQIISRLMRFNLESTRVQAGFDISANSQIYVAMIQSMNNRMSLLPNFDLVIIDEAHHSVSSTYVKVIRAYPNALILGLTATPIRMSGEGFDHLFEELIESYSIREFINQGYLSSYKHIASSFVDIDSLEQGVGLDYTERSLYQLMSSNSVMADLVNSYLKYARGKKTIIFAVSIEHCDEITERFISAGVPAAAITSKTDKKKRALLLNSFVQGEILVLVNVNIFSEGFDCPDIEAVILARPTKSLALYYQQVGRVLRPSPGKTHGLILDNAMLWKEHGVVGQEINWSLSGTKVAKNISEVIFSTEYPRERRPKKLKEVLELEMELISEIDANEIGGQDQVFLLILLLNRQFEFFESATDEELKIIFEPIKLEENIYELSISEETSIVLEQPIFTVGAYLKLLDFPIQEEFLDWSNAQKLYSSIVTKNYSHYERIYSWYSLLSNLSYAKDLEHLIAHCSRELQLARRQGVIDGVLSLNQIQSELDQFTEINVNRIIEKLSYAELVGLGKK